MADSRPPDDPRPAYSLFERLDQAAARIPTWVLEVTFFVLATAMFGFLFALFLAPDPLEARYTPSRCACRAAHDRAVPPATRSETTRPDERRLSREREGAEA